MERIQRLMRPAPRALNWKAAIPMLGLALACMTIYAEAVAADKVAGKKTKAHADLTSCAKPAWPDGAVKRNEQGTVTLGFEVGADDKLKNSKVLKSSGFADLDEAARDAIAKCTFKAATQAGKQVASNLKVQYVWSLE